MFYFVKTPFIVKQLFASYIWSKSSSSKIIYLTFDDGPTPKITQWVLAELQKYQAKATFFCIGKNIENHPEITQKIIKEGHTIGNHTQNHVKGWKTKTSTYIDDVRQGAQQLCNLTNRLLFRPPYGKIKNSQARALQKIGYQIVMWDVLSADFDVAITKEKCLQNVIKNTQNGSIIVFHDSVKANENLKFILPKMLDYFTQKGFKFKAL